MTHNYEAQRRETFDTFKQAGRGMSLPKTSNIAFEFFVEELDADWAGFERALRIKGFRTQRGTDGETLTATTGPIPVTPEAIWSEERVATELALRFDFYPDGWELAD